MGTFWEWYKDICPKMLLQMFKAASLPRLIMPTWKTKNPQISVWNKWSSRNLTIQVRLHELKQEMLKRTERYTRQKTRG